MAFVAGSTFVAGSSKSLAVSKRAVRAQTARVNMSIKKDSGEEIVTIKDIKKEEKHQGFTFWSETWNGRFAMLGFVIAVATEVINPNHPTIVDQVKTLFGQ
eukprot:Plantae.Rhodophyta-Purpureofilum_apyrenoidigerum.ctg12704.p1 GENE.Plantae.Rhodophyta-Purpureofilum_apyrenoidigerum.ctg12704~~Plantae.Rhodophyta-Purpureofilum_apyrenoidigerum.ctg12704.p1  ORF type:complete len:101 (-),score=25.24 Plantae.Rhodophyta-Purpureofilum_apyrenoidigerum.ctg12704:89-391(-)